MLSSSLHGCCEDLPRYRCLRLKGVETECVCISGRFCTSSGLARDDLSCVWSGPRTDGDTSVPENQEIQSRLPRFMSSLSLEITMRKTCILTLLLLLLLLPPPAEVNLRTKYNFGRFHYKHPKIRKSNWRGTRHHCRWFDHDMISIRDEEANRNFRGEDSWIGLYRENSTSKWKWSRRDEVADFLIWEDDPDEGENCAIKKRGEHGWRSVSCDVRHTVMCSKELLVLVKENKTWEEALMHCRALKDPTLLVPPYRNHKYDLATLLTEDDHEFAREEARRATTDEVWTGLRYLAGYLLWVDGEDVTYEGIEQCPSNGFCGTLPKAGNGSYEMRHCDERRNFFCYRKP